MIAFFLKRTLITERFGRNMLEWRHSGFSADLSVSAMESPAAWARLLAKVYEVDRVRGHLRYFLQRANCACEGVRVKYHLRKVGKA